jgi:hypothetical protein
MAGLGLFELGRDPPRLLLPSLLFITTVNLRKDRFLLVLLGAVSRYHSNLLRQTLAQKDFPFYRG